ncbi:unnamed protein product, partial [Mycena citricolor]
MEVSSCDGDAASSLMLSTGLGRAGVGDGTDPARFEASGARERAFKLARLGEDGVGRACDARNCDGRASGLVVGVVGVGGARGLSESSSSSSSSIKVPNASLEEEGLKESRLEEVVKVPGPGGKEGLVAGKLWDFYFGKGSITLPLKSPESIAADRISAESSLAEAEVSGTTRYAGDALWALEGKRDASFAKVEIPELSAPYEFRPGTFTTSSKRDSFKPSSSKDALGTLMEEEEEEEDSDKPRAPPTPTTPTTSFTRNLGQRSRAPHLRPLSLTPDALPSQFLASQALPTPSSPKRASLKALSLAPDASNRAGSVPSPTPARPRPVLNIKLEAASPSHDDTSMSIRQQPVRKSSISYKTSSTSSSVSSTGLPTPESTPTCTERRFSGYTHSSISSRSSQGSQGSMASNRLSVAEDDFLTMNSGNGRPLS